MIKSKLHTHSRMRQIGCMIVLALIAGATLTGCRVDDAGGQPAAPPKKETPSVIIGPEANFALESLAQIRKAQASFSVASEGEFGTFYDLVSHKYLNKQFVGESPIIKGYSFKMKVTPLVRNGKMATGTYTVNADPQALDGRHFYMDQDAGIHFNDRRIASANDPLLQN